MNNKTGFHRIEVEIEPTRWVAISSGDYWFGGEYPDSMLVALKKVKTRLKDRRHTDPIRHYRIVTKHEDES